MTIGQLADSASKSFFSGVTQATQTLREVIRLSGVLSIPGTGESFTLGNGVITKVKQVPDGKKVLDAQEYEITWESINMAIL